MDNFQERAKSINESLQNLSLQPREEEGEHITDLVLWGKFLQPEFFEDSPLMKLFKRLGS